MPDHEHHGTNASEEISVDPIPLPKHAAPTSAFDH
jgi:hypothetical protein